ncbi:hypothetical protein Glove_217g279 [Diversispora epigaea]|uniref:Uncharacterized protein n=1 Tax=Diversispora epigaea TaxID=1348612 RepID=A0A397IJH5_9GLOM|nr:hypothetical protein Glove_217g279 [Diversispora epigaea]
MKNIQQCFHHGLTSYSLRNHPFEFQLILRGFAPRTFWDICHGMLIQIVVTKVKGTKEIISKLKINRANILDMINSRCIQDKQNWCYSSTCYEKSIKRR